MASIAILACWLHCLYLCTCFHDYSLMRAIHRRTRPHWTQYWSFIHDYKFRTNWNRAFNCVACKSNRLGAQVSAMVPSHNYTCESDIDDKYANCSQTISPLVMHLWMRESHRMCSWSYTRAFESLNMHSKYPILIHIHLFTWNILLFSNFSICHLQSLSAAKTELTENKNKNKQTIELFLRNRGKK